MAVNEQTQEVQEDPWAAFWARFLELWEAWTPADLKGPEKPV
ncbi:hypothetical protein [Streptomyces olivaceus]|nr:hypothetical protein [Streptomyces olivaceus]